MRQLYSFFLYCILPIVLFRLFLLGFRSPGYWSRWQERLGFLRSLEDQRPVLWLHSVSVGEVEASRPLVQRLLKLLPEYQIILTTVTPTGAQTVSKHFGETVEHFYLPYDLPFSIQRFLNHIQPSLCIVMETEIWPNMYYYCHKNNIPVVLSSARLSLKSFKAYKKFPTLIRQTLQCATRVLAQSTMDAERFLSLGCDPKRLSVAGNLKFDVEIAADLVEQGKSLRLEQFAQRPVWIAASTHAKEEQLVLAVHKQILEKYPECLLILAPRHPQRFTEVARLCEKSGFETRRRSEDGHVNLQTKVYLLDTLGDLQMIFSCADIAFVGGSLVPTGGHNILEPTSLSLPVLTGPSVYNFQSICDALVDVGGLLIVNDSEELASQINYLLESQSMRIQMGDKGKKLIADNQGCSDKIAGEIVSLLTQCVSVNVS